MSAVSTSIASLLGGEAGLADLVGSRMCHDLVSPLGAIGNGLELLQLGSGPATGSPELELITESVEAARARIRLFRMAFGAAPGDQRVGAADLATLVEEFGTGKLRPELSAQGDHPRMAIKMVMLGLMCMESAMPWGGRILIGHSGANWRLVADSDRIRIVPGHWGWLSPDCADCEKLAPAEVHFALLAACATASGRTLSWEMDEAGGEISF